MGPSALPVWRLQPRPGSPHPRRRTVHACECPDELAHEGSECRRQRRAPGDQHIVEFAPGVTRARVPDCRLEAPPDTIALDCLADLPGDGEAEPRLVRRPGASLIAAHLG